MEEGLTSKQADVYNAIVKFTMEKQYPPTINELCIMTSKSIGAIQSCLRLMKRKGYISMETYKSRTIKVLK